MSSKALKEQKRLKLEELKLARAGGGKRDYKVSITRTRPTRRFTYSRLVPQPTEAEAIYDEVDDLDYKVIVKGRLQEDDFIEEDDGVSGYADNGMEDWDRSDDSAEERGESYSCSSGSGVEEGRRGRRVLEWGTRQPRRWVHS
jgi:DNA polymerase alpha subunit A